MPDQQTPYRVLILINVRWWNATAFYAVNIARILEKNGHRVFIGCRSGYPPYEKARALGLNVRPFDFTGYNPFSLVGNLFAMVRFIRRYHIQIINAHRAEDHAFAVLAGRLTGARVVLTRGDCRPIKPNALSMLKYRLCDGIVATCRGVVRLNQQVFNGLEEKTSVIYGSVDEDRFRPMCPVWETRRKYALGIDTKIVGLVGRLSPVKDPATFINAAAQVAGCRKDVTFIIAGKEVEIKTADLWQHIRRKGLEERFILLSQVDDIADLMRTFDVGVITSIDSETISRVLLEFMSIGKAVIGTRVNAIGEIIQPGISGELIAPGDDKDLAKKIDRLLSDRGLRETYAQNARRFYENAYSEGCFSRETLSVFAGALKA